MTSVNIYVLVNKVKHCMFMPNDKDQCLFHQRVIAKSYSINLTSEHGDLLNHFLRVSLHKE